MDKKVKVLIIIPAYNEADNIITVTREISLKWPEFDYLVINDGSVDETSKICMENKIHYVDLPINLGIGGAVQTGYRYARENGYDIAVQIDGDGQHDVSFLGDLVQPLIEGKADIAIGSRFLNKEGFQSTLTRRIGISFLSFLIKICTGLKIHDVTSGFRAVGRRFIEIYARYYPADYLEPEAIISAVMNGGKIMELPVVMRERESGNSSINSLRSIYYMIKVSLAIIICRISFGIRR